MPERLPYLHPSQRNLRTEQIGPSSHKNEYRSGVLIGEWAEVKTGGSVQTVQSKLQTRTIYRNSFYGMNNTEPALYAKPKEYSKDILFGHADDSVTTTTSNGATQKSLMERKQAEWESVRDPDFARSLHMKTTSKSAAYKGPEHKSLVEKSPYAVKGEIRAEMKYNNNDSLRLRS
eukprot:PhF_6_TR26985/c0_g1_i2/m.39384